MTTILLLVAVSLAIEWVHHRRHRTLSPLPATVVTQRRHPPEGADR